MRKIIVHGGKKLFGNKKIQGAKNAALPIIAAAVLIEKKVVLRNVPNITDVNSFIDIINHLGVKTSYKNNVLIMENEKIKNKKIVKKQSNKSRASFLFFGALFSRFGKAEIAETGGCRIGERPLDIHKKAFDHIKEGQKEIYLAFPSVGATENLLIYAAGEKEKFTIKNASIEPEVLDLASFLRKAGAKITRKSNAFYIKGGALKKEVEYEIMPDRIAALTYIMAGKTTGGDVKITNINYNENIKPVTDCLNKKKIETNSHPGFPTDAGAIVLPYLVLKKDKETEYKENIFENRMGILEELKKAGGNIEISGNEAKIKGVKKLAPYKYEGNDLRAAAGLVIAALATEGKSEITGLEYIERGYENFIENLQEIGADIKVIEEKKQRFSLKQLLS